MSNVFYVDSSTSRKNNFTSNISADVLCISDLNTSNNSNISCSDRLSVVDTGLSDVQYSYAGSDRLSVVECDSAFSSQQYSPLVTNSEFTTITSSAFIPSNFSLKSDIDENITLERFLINDTEFSSFDEFLRSDKEKALPEILNFLKRISVIKKKSELILSILLVVILVSIFSQLFGGNRSLPVA